MATTAEMTREQKIDVLARVTHDANRAWCEAHGDHSQPEWDAAPDWQTSSAVNGVEMALTGASPEELHENWCKVKVDDGWVHGAVKDPEAKTHPCLVPYAELPQTQRAKDALFHAVIGALAPALRLRLAEPQEVAERDSDVQEVAAGESFPPIGR